MAYMHRLLEDSLKKTVGTRPLVYLNGMRQCGKSTLVQNISVGKKLNYITFDNPVHLSFARNDPVGFLQQLPHNRLSVIDEVQLAPELFRYFKIAIDEKRLANKNRALYVLTGSANIFALPKLADALVGRLSILTLYPFSASEIKGTGVNFMEKLWDTELYPRKYPRANIVGIISNATFPEIALDKRKNRYLWFNDYITTLLQRDVRTLADIRNPDNVYQLLVSFSQRAGGLLNNANVMKETGLDAKTYEKYKALCNNTFLTFELPSWTKPNRLNKRFVKQKKMYFTDTSLLCHIMQRDMEDIYKNDKTAMGHIFENFIATEIMKAAKSLDSFSVSHFNPVQNQGKEVDFVVESPNGKTIGIEVKLDRTINEKDWANMNTLQETIGSRFMKGIIIYTGTDLVQVSRNIWAVPVNYLWMNE
ncbi:MAG: ATP-binding protein [Treponema sp.]|jgi:predicted AAA+ superfamily ATPase|nr:ATP-binding protein [Treponema sp.]